MIQLSNISKRFETPGKVVEAVKHVTLSIDKGDIFGIMGFSGAGKSTLVRCINLLETPTEGTVTVDGVELTGLSEKELRQARKNIGMIFQHFNLMPSRTVFENIAYPLKGRPKEEIEKKITSLLELGGLSDKRDVFPSQLSGGQKQRVAIARALATDPQVLLCDEATSALDPQTTTAILKLLKQVNRELGVTIVIITHAMAVIKEICNRAAVMEHGEVIEQGDVYSLFATPQSPVTQGFINTSSLAQKVEELDREGSPVVALKPGEQILQLTYLGMGASQALISEVSRKFSINCNIVFGSIEIIQESPLGRLIIIASGREGDIAQAIAYLRQQKVEVEVLKQCQK